MVFLSVLSNPFDYYWNASYLYLWGYQFVVLVKNKADDAGPASPFFGRQGNRKALDLERLQSIGLSKKESVFMNIKMNHYMGQASYTAAAGGKSSEPYAGGKIGSEAKSDTNRDTVSISAAGQQFSAEKMESGTDMEVIHISSDLDEFRNAVCSMNEKLPVSWKAMVDPYNTITDRAKVEARLKQLADPAASHKDEDMEKAAEVYAKEIIDALIEKKKTMLADGTAKTAAGEYEEYKMAYDAYHSENGSNLIEKMTGDTKKAYDIYKNIIDGTKISINDEEFLIFHNCTMYRAAKAEHILKTEELYNAMNGVPLR